MNQSFLEVKHSKALKSLPRSFCTYIFRLSGDGKRNNGVRVAFRMKNGCILFQRG